MNEDKCFFDKKKCLKPKNIILNLVLDNKTKVQYCCTDCLYKIKASNNVEDEKNVIGNKIDKKCPCCNSNILDICQDKAGCPLCYVYFKKDFEEILELYHGSYKHNGKTLSKDKKSLLTLNVLNDLENLLKIKKGKEAKLIKDLIKKLKKSN